MHCIILVFKGDSVIISLNPSLNISSFWPFDCFKTNVMSAFKISLMLDQTFQSVVKRYIAYCVSHKVFHVELISIRNELFLFLERVWESIEMNAENFRSFHQDFIYFDNWIDSLKRNAKFSVLVNQKEFIPTFFKSFNVDLILLEFCQQRFFIH